MLCLNKTGGKTTRQMGEISKDPDGPGCIPDQPHETLQGRVPALFTLQMIPNM